MDSEEGAGEGLEVGVQCGERVGVPAEGGG